MSDNPKQAVAILRQRGVTNQIDTAILLGSGLGGVAEGMADAVTVPYADLPGFPALDEPGQLGRVVAGKLEGVPVAFLQGCGHFYLSGDPACMSDALETMKALGARQLLIFGAVGSLRPDIYPGNLFMVTDHIALTGVNPLIGLADARAFVSLNEAYDPRLQTRLKRAAAAGGVQLHEGVMIWTCGPTFATPAESKMARLIGADMIGFGVAPEIILARRLGLRATAVAASTHFSAGVQGSEPQLAECQKQAGAASIGLRRLLRAYLKIGGPLV
jgi:purine-nucleoside phosphorylase